MFRSIRTLRSIPRIKDIAFVLARHGFHQVAAYLQAPVSSRVRRFFSPDTTPEVIHQPERLRLLIQDLGPTFIKFGQLLSTRPDLLPAPYIRELEKLQDDVQASPVEQILEVISADLKNDVNSLFREFSVQPLASASIGQVHRAITLGGAEVVVKVRKRGLGRVVEQDLQVLRLLADVIGEWPPFQIHDLEGILALFERSIRRELDFTHERFNLRRMREQLRDNDHIRIPEVYNDLCSKRVLTMEYLAGKKFSALRPEDLVDGEGEALAERVASAVIRQVFEDGIFHADLHPGNLIRMPDGSVGLIDFGNIGRCTPGMMDDLLLLLYYLVKRDYSLIGRLVLKVGRTKADVDLQDLTYDLMDTLEPYYGLSIRDVQISGLLNSLFAISIRCQITLPPQYVLLARTLITLEGVVRTLAPNMDVLSQLQPSLLKVVRSRWVPARIYKELESTFAELANSLRLTPIHLAEVLKRTAEGRLRIDTHLRNTNDLEKRLELLGQRVPLAILAAATLIGGVLLLNEAFGNGNTFQLVLGCFSLISSLGLAVWMAMRT